MSARTLSPDLVAAFKRLRLGGLLPTLVERMPWPRRRTRRSRTSC
jgi:hypothetical protein